MGAMSRYMQKGLEMVIYLYRSLHLDGPRHLPNKLWSGRPGGRGGILRSVVNSDTFCG